MSGPARRGPAPPPGTCQTPGMGVDDGDGGWKPFAFRAETVIPLPLPPRGQAQGVAEEIEGRAWHRSILYENTV